jgi:polysaccharide deacetylase family protein (PEP-CTERM system associated)
VANNTLRILDLLDEFSVKATFFVLGWVAFRYPRIVGEIDRRGHEVACHGFGHQRLSTLAPSQFRSDIRRSKKLLENICGRAVFGYRAPSYSIVKETLWALDILIEEGFAYDSSIFPVIHDSYGIPGARRFPHVIERQAGAIREFPLSTLRVGMGNKTVNLPVAGGGYLRLFPVPLIERAFSHINHREHQPAVLYVHPWEIDPDQPRIKAGIKSRFRHYLNLSRTEHKLRYLLSRMQFAPLGAVLGLSTGLMRPGKTASACPSPTATP